MNLISLTMYSAKCIISYLTIVNCKLKVVRHKIYMSTFDQQKK